MFNLFVSSAVKNVAEDTFRPDVSKVKGLNKLKFLSTGNISWIVQLVEHPTVRPEVRGSNPALHSLYLS